MRHAAVVALAISLSTSALAQVPQPFPRPGTPTAQPPPPRPEPPVPQAPPPARTAADPNAPTEAALGAPLYPTAQFLGSYDAGRGQRYYLFGVTAAFVDVVAYYQNQTRERGDLVFKDPPTHQFHGEPFARYREETMVSAPGVTVKDWTAGGSAGYPNPTPGAQPARFPTIIMIVTPPPGVTAR